MHAIHTSEGVVLGKRGVGEAHALVYVLTHELGLVRAAARSTRVERSKLRYGLEPLTRARFAFVKGRHEWRLVQVHGAQRLLAGATPAARATAGRISQLLLRLIRGQEPMPDIYKDVVEGFTLLENQKSPGQKSSAAPRLFVQNFSDSLETVLVLRILSHLGYLPHTEALAPFIAGGFSVELSSKALENRSLLIKTINESLQATGL